MLCNIARKSIHKKFVCCSPGRQLREHIFCLTASLVFETVPTAETSVDGLILCLEFSMEQILLVDLRQIVEGKRQK